VVVGVVGRQGLRVVKELKDRKDRKVIRDLKVLLLLHLVLKGHRVVKDRLQQASVLLVLLDLKEAKGHKDQHLPL
jgi:hypothetical protein